MVAVGRGHLGTVKLLLEAGADPTKRDKKGRTALYYAKNSIMGITNSEEIQLIENAINNYLKKHSEDNNDDDDDNNNNNETYKHEKRERKRNHPY